jgi:CheY-like chemotaxis protein
MAKRTMKSRPKSRLTALIADDQPQPKGSLRKLLQHKGFRVTCTGSISESAKKLGDGRFDLIILDVRMPETRGKSPELDGGLVLVRLLQRVMFTASDAVVVVFTAYPNVRDWLCVNRAGAYYLPKTVPGRNMTKELAEECTRLVLERRRQKSDPKPTWVAQHYDKLVKEFEGKTVAIVEAALAKGSTARGGTIVGDRKVFTARSLKELQKKIARDPKLRRANPLIVSVRGG